MPTSPLPTDLAAAIEHVGDQLGGLTRIEHFAEVDSTNDIALARASAGAPYGTVVIADMQRAGRGRLGRTWHSPPDAGIYLSVVLRADSWSRSLPLVTLMAGVAVVRGLEAATGLRAELKWPNDVVIGRPWRKLAGILTEAVSTSGRIEAVVVGIGVNLRASSFPPDLRDKATAVEVELGRAVDRATCIVRILSALHAGAGQLSSGDGVSILDEWRALGRAGLQSAPVRWQELDRQRRGLAVDIDEAGALLVDGGGGRIERIISGEVFWERLSRER